MDMAVNMNIQTSSDFSEFDALHARIATVGGNKEIFYNPVLIKEN